MDLTHEEIQDASTNARLDAQAEHERGDECVICGRDAYTCEHYEPENTGEDWEIYWDERRAQ